MTIHAGRLLGSGSEGGLTGAGAFAGLMPVSTFSLHLGAKSARTTWIVISKSASCIQPIGLKTVLWHSGYRIVKAMSNSITIQNTSLISARSGNLLVETDRRWSEIL